VTKPIVLPNPRISTQASQVAGTTAGLLPYLRAEGLSKAYGATIALSHVSLDVHAGEVHALLGENGAGKSTLVKILSGIVLPDQGRLEVDGRSFAPGSLLEARAAGVSTAFQELSLLPNLSVAVNLMLPKLLKGRAGINSMRRNEQAAAALLQEFGVTTVDPASLVADLSLAEKQRVEIVRALSHRPRLLVLDEPTAALADPGWLFDIVERLTGEGVAILYISHRLAEVRRLCRRGTVLRNGRSIATVDLTGTPDSEIFRMMVGTSQDEPKHKVSSSRQSSAPRLAVKGLTGPNVHDVSFEVADGEILGVAALEGQGQRPIFRMLAGLEPITGGSVSVDGKPADLRSPAAALRSGIGFLPEERKTEGIFLGLKTASNVSLPILNRVLWGPFLNHRRENAVVAEASQDVDLAKRYQAMRISSLSGGNQQKALLARVLLAGPRNLVLYDPTRGVDVGTKQVIYAAIRNFVDQGGSALIYSTELAELVHLAHRCIVVYGGRIVGDVAGPLLTEDRLVSFATGHGDIAA
jgi:ribose transport system ATP-binding protein